MVRASETSGGGKTDALEWHKTGRSALTRSRSMIGFSPFRGVLRDVVVGRGQGTFHVERSHRRDHVGSGNGPEGVGSVSGTDRGVFQKAPDADELTLQARNRGPLSHDVHVGVSTDRFLDGLDVQDAQSAVRSSFPSAGSEK